MPTVPPILYKYIKTDYALAVLQTLKLKLTPPIEFDDPFEFLIRTDNIVQRSLVKKMVKGKDFLRRVYQEARAQGRQGSFKEFKRTFRANREREIDQAMQFAPPHASAFAKGPFVAEMSQKFALLCLTETPDSILMWSHYSSGHRGIVLGIEIPPHWKMLPVRYDPTNERVSINLKLHEDIHAADQTSRDLVQIKSKYWGYEREWRGLSPLELLHKESVNGKTLYFATIEPRIIMEIILGRRFPDEHLAEIRTLHRNKFPHARLLKADFHDTQFALVLKEL